MSIPFLVLGARILGFIRFVPLLKAYQQGWVERFYQSVLKLRPQEDIAAVLSEMLAASLYAWGLQF
ncbi:hypothetical protein [Hymenobacter oligotrophus]|nr:hypothetical protein [Hymenobacter oligotrophus]